MTLSDYQSHNRDELVDLWTQCDLARPWNNPDDDISRAMNCPSSTILVGFEEGRLVGSVMVGHDGHRGWIWYMAVDPSYRSRGFGKQIIAGAETWLRESGAIKMMLLVRRSNQKVIGFYESSGFSESDVVTLERWLTPDGQRPADF